MSAKNSLAQSSPLERLVSPFARWWVIGWLRAATHANQLRRNRDIWSKHDEGTRQYNLRRDRWERAGKRANEKAEQHSGPGGQS